jgi:PAS domain S-box-containing protein
MSEADILIVEDERIVAEDIKDTLQEIGYGVCGVCASGRDALQQIAEHRPDLVLMDIVLKGELNGIETAARARERNSTPVVYLSAYGDDKTIERAKKTEPLGYLIKPFDDRELHSAVETALYRHKMERKLNHLNAVLRAIRNVNQLITQEKDREKLLSQACRMLIETRGFHNVWIGLLQDPPPGEEVVMDQVVPLKPFYHAGFPDDFEAMGRFLESGQLPHCVQKALQSRGVQATLDPSSSCGGCPVAERYAENGALSTRLEHGDRFFGWLCAAVPQEYAGDSTEQELFAEVAGDIAYALSALEADKDLRFQSMVLENIQDLITATDLEGRIIYVNEAEAKMFGVPREKLLGKSIFDYGEDPSRGATQAEILEKTIEEGQWRGEVVNYDADGNERILDCRTWTMRDRKGKPIALCSCATDITERKRTETEMRRMQKLDSLGTVAGGIAHDFNNMLMGIFGNIELAQAHLPEGHQARRFLQEAHGALENARQLTGQLLTFARGGQPVFEVVDTKRLVRETVRFNLSGSQINPHFDLPEHIWPIRADGSQIGQVIANLVINAQQAMPAGGNLFIKAANIDEVESHHVPNPDEPHVRLQFRDEGTGIPSKIANRIFDPYFTTKETGRGLGLAVAHSIIERHEGRIRVDSTPGVGTTFTLLLPAAGSQPVDSPPESETAARETGVDSLRLLLMDDEELVRSAGGKMMQACGHSVDFALDGEEAVAMYADAQETGRPYDVVVLDLTVPGAMGGREAIEELMAVDPEVRAVVSSGYSSDPVLSEYREYGFSGCLAKPFEISELKKVLSEVMEEA